MGSFYVETKKESFLIDLIKADGHKYLRKFKRGGKWVYIYQEPGKKARHIDKAALGYIKRLAELGDEQAKRMMHAVPKVHPEKLQTLRKLSDLGDKDAHKHLKPHFGIDRESEKLEEAVIPKAVADQDSLDVVLDREKDRERNNEQR